MNFPSTIRNYNAFMDGISYAGIVSKGMISALKEIIERHRGAGMDAPYSVAMGTEAMTAKLTFDEFVGAPIRAFGRESRIVLRPVGKSQDDTVVVAHVFSLGGRITEANWGELEAGKASKLEITMEVDFFQYELDGEVLVKIDVQNMIRIVDGVDQLAEMRRAMGV